MRLVRTAASASVASRNANLGGPCRICHIVPACYGSAMSFRSCQHHTAQQARMKPKRPPIDGPLTSALCELVKVVKLRVVIGLLWRSRQQSLSIVAPFNINIRILWGELLFFRSILLYPGDRWGPPTPLLKVGQIRKTASMLS